MLWHLKCEVTNFYLDCACKIKDAIWIFGIASFYETKILIPKCHQARRQKSPTNHRCFVDVSWCTLDCKSNKGIISFMAVTWLSFFKYVSWLICHGERNSLSVSRNLRNLGLSVYPSQPSLSFALQSTKR